MEDEIRFHLEFEHTRKPNTPKIRRGIKASSPELYLFWIAFSS